MHATSRLIGAAIGGMVMSCATIAGAQDWPQWRGPNRDGKATGFHAPGTWPQELKRNWSVAVGEGVSTPALVGDRLYVFAREEGNEITRCLAADTGTEIWQNKYAAQDADGAAARFPVPGPRSSPALAEGKVVTLGTRSVLSCLDAETGALLWRKDEYANSRPQFYVSSSPVVVEGLCIAQLGGREGQGNGGLIAYDLTSGNEKWSWTDDSPAYASPVVTTIGDRKVIVFVSDKSLAAVGATDGKTLWKTNYEQGRYNAATPVVERRTLIYAGPGRGTTAVSLEPEAAALAVKELWNNPDNSLMYNSPVLRDGLLFGLSNSDNLFCVNAENGQTAWSVTASGEPAAAQGSGEQQQPQPGQGRRRRGGGGGGGYGSIVDVGSALLALTPNGQLAVYAPDGSSFQKLASYKVAEGGTYAYPIASGHRIYVKDRDSLTLWTVE